MGSSTAGVLLVDDHAIVRAGFRRLLEESGGFRVVAEAETGEDACILYRQLKPDIVVMDLSLPGIGGLEATKRIITFDNRARIVVFTMHESPMLAERAIKTGAFGYFVKRSSPDVAIEAVREAASNRVYIEPSIAQTLAIDSARGIASSFDRLSVRELEIIRLIMDGRKTGAIAQTLNLSEKTIANNISRIKKKLGAENTVELVRLALQAGIINP